MSNLHEKANEFMEQQRYEEAVPLFKQLIKDSDASPDWYYNWMLGLCYRFTGKLEKAQETLSIAVNDCGLKEEVWAGDPRAARSGNLVLHAYGIVCQLNEDYPTAVFAFEMAIKINPMAFSSYNSLGITLRKSGNPGGAITCYTQAEELILNACLQAGGMDVQDLIPGDPIYALILNNRGLCYMDMGQIREAASDWCASIDEIPESFEYPSPQENLDLLLSNEP